MSVLTTILWPLLQKFWKPIALTLAVLAVFLYGYHKGDAHRDRVWKAKIEAEREKQAQIVFRADNKALAEITRLNTELETSNAQINELLIEAERDANAARPAIGISGVQRFNRIGPR